MITPRPHLLATLILSLAACSTQEFDGDGFFRQLHPDDHPISMIGSLVTAGGKLRIKVDGQFLVTEVADRKFIYLELQGGTRSNAAVPTGAPIDLVNEAGQTVLHIDPVGPALTASTLIWVHDSPTGLVAEIPDFVPDDDATTAEVGAVNVSVAERVIVSRCAGVVHCPTCGTVPGSSSLPGTFEPSACEALTTVGPGQEWTSKLEPTNIIAGGESACLAVQDEGSLLGPTCLVDLNHPSVDFQERSQIFIDGLAATTGSLTDGTAVAYPGAFAAGK